MPRTEDMTIAQLEEEESKLNRLLKTTPRFSTEFLELEIRKDDVSTELILRELV